MQVTETFKKVINDHLQGLADKDALFAETLKKPAKNIEDCVTYILNTVQKTHKNGFADEEIFGMAVHYYDEDVIEVGKPGNGKVVVNHSLAADAKASPASPSPVKSKAVKKAVKVEVPAHRSLFDM
jgi:hypothetical protein